MRNILFPAPEATKFLHGIVVGSHDECEVIEATREGKFFYLQKEQKEIFFKGYYFTGVACAFSGVGMGVLNKKIFKIMIYINKQKNFRVYFGGCQHAILEADNGIGYDCFGSENHSHIGDDIKALAKFFWKAEASYLDNDNNLRVMWLSYDASKVALFNGHSLIDRNGNLYEYNDVFDVEINGKTTVGQLPYGKYMIDFERTIEMIETGDLIDDEDNVKDEEEHTETPSAVCETSPKKSSLLKNVGLFLAGVAVGSSAMFYIKNTNNNNY